MSDHERDHGSESDHATTAVGAPADRDSRQRSHDQPAIHLEVKMPPTNWVQVGILVVAILGSGVGVLAWLDGQFGLLDGRIDVLMDRLAHLEGLLEGWRNRVPED